MTLEGKKTSKVPQIWLVRLPCTYICQLVLDMDVTKGSFLAGWVFCCRRKIDFKTIDFMLTSIGEIEKPCRETLLQMISQKLMDSHLPTSTEGLNLTHRRCSFSSI